MRRLLLACILVFLSTPSWAGIRYVGGMVNGFAGKTSSTTVTFALTNGMGNVPEGGDLVIVSYFVGGTTDLTLTITNGSAVAYSYEADLYQDDTYDSNMRVGWRFMPSTPETTFILSQTFSTANAGRYTVHVFRGVDTGSPMDVAATTWGFAGNRSVNPPSILPTTDGSWIYVTGGAASAVGGTYTASYLSDFRAGTTADNVDAQIGSGYVMWTSGTYDPAPFSGGGTTTVDDSWTSVTAALRPATYASNIVPTSQRVGNVANATSLALAMPSSVTANNHVVVGCATWWGTDTNSLAAGDLTKTAGTSTIGSVTVDSQLSNGASPNIVEATVFSVPITGTGTLTLTVADDVADSFTCVAQEYSGMDATTRVQGQNTGSGTSTTPATGTVAGTGEALFFGAHVNAAGGAITLTQGADFDGLYEMTDGTTFTSGGFEERIVTTDTTDAADWTLSSSLMWTAAMAVYQDTTGGEPPPTCPSIALMGIGCR